MSASLQQQEKHQCRGRSVTIHHRDADLIRGGKSTLGCREATSNLRSTRLLRKQPDSWFPHQNGCQGDSLRERFAVARAEHGKAGLIPSFSLFSWLEPQERGEWSEQGIEDSPGPGSFGKFRIAHGFGASDRNQFRLQHCSRAIPWSDCLWSRYSCLHSPHPDISGYAFLPNRFRKGCCATEFSGGKKRSLSRISQKRMGVRHLRRAVIAAVSESNCGLPQFAHSDSGCPARNWGSFLRSPGKPARLHPGRLRLPSSRQQSRSGGTGTTGWISPAHHARLRRPRSDRGQCCRGCGSLSCCCTQTRGGGSSRTTHPRCVSRSTAGHRLSCRPCAHQ